MIASQPILSLNLLSLGGKIRQRRKLKKLTLSQLAEECSISPSFLSQIERDQAKPSVGTLHTIADKLGVTLAEFFDDSQPGADNGVPKPNEPLAQIVRGDRRKVLIYPGSGIRNELGFPGPEPRDSNDPRGNAAR